MGAVPGMVPWAFNGGVPVASLPASLAFCLAFFHPFFGPGFSLRFRGEEGEGGVRLPRKDGREDEEGMRGMRKAQKRSLQADKLD